MTTKAHHQGRGHTSNHDGTEEIAALKDDLVSLKETISDGVQTIGENGTKIAKSAGAAAKATVGHYAETGAKRVRETTEKAQKMIVARPLTSVAIAAAAGALLGGAWVMMRRRS